MARFRRARFMRGSTSPGPLLAITVLGILAILLALLYQRRQQVARPPATPGAAETVDDLRASDSSDSETVDAITGSSRPNLPGRPFLPAQPGENAWPSYRSQSSPSGSDLPEAPNLGRIPSTGSVRAVPSPGIPPPTGEFRTAAPVAGPASTFRAPVAAARPRDNSDFDRYVRWMRYVEQERANLRSRGDSVIRGAVQAPADPRTRGALQAALGSAQALSSNLTRTRPDVPPDCQFLDRSYVAAITQEGASTADLLEALSRGDANRVRTICQGGTAGIDRGIGVASASLEQVSRTRGVNPSLRLEGGETSIIAQAQRLLAR